MGIKITARPQIKKEIESRLDKAEKAFKRAVNEEKNEIIRRTQAGKDYKGSAFEPYAESTIEQKRRQKKQISPVNLSDSGSMLQNISVSFQRSAKELVGRIKFTSSAEAAKALYHHGGGRVPKREFFALSKKGLQRIREAVQKALRSKQ